MATPFRALIIEDRPADAELLVAELRRAGFDPDWCRVDTEAADLAHLGRAPEVILADYHLPQFSAPWALALLQARGLDVPFVVVSGAVSEEVAVECMRRGAADYLFKDRLARLGPAVAQALDARRLRDASRRLADVARALAEVGHELASTLDPAQVGDRIVLHLPHGRRLEPRRGDVPRGHRSGVPPEALHGRGGPARDPAGRRRPGPSRGSPARVTG